MINGGTGIRGGDCANEPVATAFPSTAALGATFNPTLSRQLGQALGAEARANAHQVLLGPGMNLHRVPYGGRNYEYVSEDPYLSGVISVETIKGIQSQGIHAAAKHFAANEQETMRWMWRPILVNSQPGGRFSSSFAGLSFEICWTFCSSVIFSMMPLTCGSASASCLGASCAGALGPGASEVELDALSDLPQAPTVTQTSPATATRRMIPTIVSPS